jgi:CBS domain-containing protein
MKVGELCMRDVVVTGGETGIIELAALMREYHVGDIVITKDESNKKVPVGIVTDRDIVLEIVAKEVQYGSCTASDIMSTELLCVREEDEVWQTLEIMRSKGIRRVPVVDTDDGLVGIISADDIVEFLAEEMRHVTALYRHQPLKEQHRRP